MVESPQQRPECPVPLLLPAFGVIESERILANDDLFVVMLDKYPISPGHTLIIARRPVATFQKLTDIEKVRMLYWIDWVQKHLAATLSPQPNGFNFGLNDGPAAGQTISQLHFHIIPRYLGDVHDPRGGVRWIIPARARYWTSP